METLSFASILIGPRQELVMFVCMLISHIDAEGVLLSGIWRTHPEDISLKPNSGDHMQLGILEAPVSIEND